MRPTICWISTCYAATLLLLVAAGCDHGLAPPDVKPPGQILGIVRYAGSWPPASEFVDLRFVAMRFVPQDTSDFLELNRMAISDRLIYGVAADTFLIGNVDPGVFFYSGVAQRFTTNPLDWRPIGLVTTSDGIFEVEPSATTEIEVLVDFSNPPVFPPQ